MSLNLSRWFVFSIAALFAAPGLVSAADQSPMTAALQHIDSEWARITYQVKDPDQQQEQMEALAAAAATVVKQYPDRAEPLVWAGIVTSSEAKFAGGLRALGLAKNARDLFEKAGRIDFKAVDGAVPTSLGALYYKVPGFPLSFGDDDRAQKYLEQGLQISPDGLDANYFYADFLYGQGEYSKAASLLKHALAVAPNPARPIWDAGRRAEIRSLLTKVEDKEASR